MVSLAIIPIDKLNAQLALVHAVRLLYVSATDTRPPRKLDNATILRISSLLGLLAVQLQLFEVVRARSVRVVRKTGLIADEVRHIDPTLPLTTIATTPPRL